MEIIKKLDELKAEIEKGGPGPGEWKQARETIESAMDIIYDSEGLEKTYKALFQKYEVPDPAVQYADGSWHCSACGKRVHPMAHFCNWCGKRLRKGGGRRNQDR